MVASLKEDEFGVVQNHVSKILSSFNATLATLERYVADPPLHWTDTGAKNSSQPVWLPEPEALIAQLKATIKEISDAFRPYRDSLPAELREMIPPK